VADFNIGLMVGKGSFATVKRSVHKKTGHAIAMKIYDKKNLKKD